MIRYRFAIITALSIIGFVVAANAQKAGYAGMTLQQALDAIQKRYNLNLIYSSDLVKPGMKIAVEPAGDSPVEVLTNLLQPFRLKTTAGPGNSLLIVAVAPPARKSAPKEEPLPEQIVGDDEFMMVPFVTVYVSARDDDNHFVTDLRPHDLIVKEQGKELPIREFTNFSSVRSNKLGEHGVPLSVVVVLDSSESMNSTHRGTKRYDIIKGAVVRLLNELGSEDQMMVLGFNKEVWPITSMSANFSFIRANLSEQNVTGGTSAVFDAVQRAVTELEPHYGRKIIVLASDGEDTASSTKLNDLLLMLGASDVTLLAFGTVTRNRISQEGREALEKMAEVTGGYAFFPSNMGDLDDVMEQVRKAMRSQYSIGYIPPDLDQKGWRQISIESRIPGVRLRYRKSYLF